MRELVCVWLRTENFVASRTYMNDKRLALIIINLLMRDSSETGAYLVKYIYIKAWARQAGQGGRGLGEWGLGF